jgi:two-component system nitrate/nitrite response regulator NarL
VTPIRVMVVDDHSVVREGIRHVLADAMTFTVVGEADTAASALAQVDLLVPDVIVLDISLPGGSGLAAVPEILERRPAVRILMLSVHDDTQYVVESVRAGAHGYLRKDSTPAELRSAIQAVHAGQRYYSPQVAGALAEALRGEATAPESGPPRAKDVLTPREVEILTHVANGDTNREIGTRLGISTRTVEAHRDSLMRKLGVRTVAGLTRLAVEQGLVGGR